MKLWVDVSKRSNARFSFTHIHKVPTPMTHGWSMDVRAGIKTTRRTIEVTMVLRKLAMLRCQM